MAGITDPEFIKNFAEQINTLWIQPEIKRRRDAGLIDEGFKIAAAQIIMNFNSATVVRFNEEVKVVVNGSFKKEVKMGESALLTEIDTIESLELTKDDANAGHITMLYYSGGWITSFDFLYNKAHSLRHLQAAREFLDASIFSAEKENFRAFLDTLFSATELMAKSLLMMHDNSILDTKKHGVVHGKYNLWAKSGNVDHRHTQLLNRLSNLRSSSRYLRGDLVLSSDDVKDMIIVAEAMYTDLEKIIPKRDL